jgi:iron complex outermembrane receptor protein
VELDTVQVETNLENEEKAQKNEKFLKSSGQTIGDLLKEEIFVDSASFGPAVGRPVVKGLDGYRVGITNGSIGINDLSAMSQDHAVAMMTKSVQKIDLIKGTSSLLYGNNSGGVIRNLGEEHNPELQNGFNSELEFMSGSNGAGTLYGGKLNYGINSLSFYISHYSHNASEYDDGNGNFIGGSDTSASQTHLVGGYEINKNNLFKIYFDDLNKNYGIPNTTKAHTSIEMEQQRYGFVFFTKEFLALKNIQTEIQKSEYLHTEYEGTSADGLFGQNQFGLNSKGSYENDNFSLDFNVQFEQSDYKVCHEHGECTEFKTAIRTSNEDGFELNKNYDKFGLPFSHGHPMPNIDEQKIAFAILGKKIMNEFLILDSSFRFENRNINIDNSNIQEAWLVTRNPNYYDSTSSNAKSGSIGAIFFLNSDSELETTVSYIERLPSSSELYWNGFHHATNSYIFGNSDLKNEKSINFDASLNYKQNKNSSYQINSFFYNFSSYIFQNPVANLTDPYHHSEVWKTKSKKAKLYGLALKYIYDTFLFKMSLKQTFGFEAIQGVFTAGGNIPRISPYRLYSETKLNTQNDIETILQLKYFDKSRNLAENESFTPEYFLLNFSINKIIKSSKSGELNLYFKGDNLLNQQGYNHISFLKETAPIAGRQLSLGVKYNF